MSYKLPQKDEIHRWLLFDCRVKITASENYIKKTQRRGVTLQQIYRSKLSNHNHSHKSYSLFPGLKCQNINMQLWESSFNDTVQEQQNSHQKASLPVKVTESSSFIVKKDSLKTKSSQHHD